MTQRFDRFQASGTQFFRDWTRIDGFRTEFEFLCPSVLSFMGHLNLIHRNLCAGPVGWAVRATLRRADRLDLLPPVPASSAPNPSYYPAESYIRGAKFGGNIASIEDHYGTAVLIGRKELTLPGAYRLEFWGNSHSTAAPNLDGLIAVNIPGGWPAEDPYNGLHVTVEDLFADPG